MAIFNDDFLKASCSRITLTDDKELASILKEYGMYVDGDSVVFDIPKGIIKMAEEVKRLRERDKKDRVNQILKEYGLLEYMDSDVISIEDMSEEITAMSREVDSLRRENEFLRKNIE